MKRHRFSLAGVLRVRQLEEDLARGAVLAAATGHDLARARVEAQLARYDTLPMAREAEAPETFAGRQARAAFAAATVAAARGAAEETAGELARRRTTWRGASMRVAALERLEERQAAEHQRMLRREEERAVDDLVTGQHARERS